MEYRTKIMKNEIINMFRDSPWPGNVLSNFAKTPFEIDGIKCSCSESFIQSLKIKNVNDQKDFCLLQGQEAWELGSKLTNQIFESGHIWWIGDSIPLHSDQHFNLVKRGLYAKFTQSKIALDALHATGETKLIHDYGQKVGKRESLPVEIFCSIVTNIRAELSA